MHFQTSKKLSRKISENITGDIFALQFKDVNMRITI